MGYYSPFSLFSGFSTGRGGPGDPSLRGKWARRPQKGLFGGPKVPAGRGFYINPRGGVRILDPEVSRTRRVPEGSRKPLPGFPWGQGRPPRQPGDPGTGPGHRRGGGFTSTPRGGALSPAGREDSPEPGPGSPGIPESRSPPGVRKTPPRGVPPRNPEKTGAGPRREGLM